MGTIFFRRLMLLASMFFLVVLPLIAQQEEKTDFLVENEEEILIEETVEDTAEEEIGEFESIRKKFQISNGEGGITGLRGAVNIEISNDGNDVYVAGYGEDTLAFFKYQEESRSFLFHSAYKNKMQGIEGLRGIWDVVISPDGRDVYASGHASDSVVFFRKAENGSLVWVESYFNNKQQIKDMNGPREMAISSDGRHIYVVNEESNSVLYFARDSQSGRLFYKESEVDGHNGVDGLQGARGISMNRKGTKVFVVGYKDNSLVSFSRNEDTGVLTLEQVLKNGKEGVEGLAGASSVTLSNDESHIYVVGFNHGTLTDFFYDTEGRIVVSHVFKNGEGGITGLKQAYKVASTQSNKIYVSGYGDNAVSEFGYKESEENVEFTQISVFRNGVADIDSLEGAWGLAVHPSGVVLATGYKSNAIAMFGNDESTGRTMYLGALYNGMGEVSGLQGAITIAMSNNGRNFYVGGMYNNEIGVFTQDTDEEHILFTSSVQGFISSSQKSSPSLTEPPILSVGSGVNGIWDIEVSNDGKNVYALQYSSDSLLSFKRNESDGSLVYMSTLTNNVDGVEGIWGAYDLAISNDGKNVYVTGYKNDAIAVFDRNDEGRLSFNTAYLNNGQSNLLDGAYSVKVSKDDRAVYVTSYFSDALVVFSRNTDGTLTLIQSFTQKNVQVSGLDGAFDIAMSSDGNIIYVSGNISESIVVFEKNEDDTLVYRSTVTSGEQNVSGLTSARDLVVSPDDKFLYVTTERGVSVFSSESTPLVPVFIETYKDDNVKSSLDGSWGIKVSPDGEKIYVVSYQANTLSVFSREP